MPRPRRARARGRSTDFHATGPRLALRPLTQSDLPAVEPWYGETVLRFVPGDLQLADLRRQLTDTLRDEHRHLLAITIHDISVPVGLLCFRTDYPRPGTFTIDLLLLESPHRGRGLGGEAVIVLEKEVVGRGMGQRFLAPVAASQGRALYFWLRLGYRPLLQAETRSTATLSPIVWMARDAGEHAEGRKGY